MRKSQRAFSSTGLGSPGRLVLLPLVSSPPPPSSLHSGPVPTGPTPAHQGFSQSLRTHAEHNFPGEASRCAHPSALFPHPPSQARTRLSGLLLGACPWPRVAQSTPQQAHCGEERVLSCSPLRSTGRTFLPTGKPGFRPLVQPPDWGQCPSDLTLQYQTRPERATPR